MKQQHYSCLLYSKRLLLVTAVALAATIGTFTVTSSVNADDHAPVVAVQQSNQTATKPSAVQDDNVANSASNIKVDNQNQNVQTTAQKSVAGTDSDSVKKPVATPKGKLVTDSNGKASYYNDAGQKIVGTGNTASTLAYKNVNGKTYAFNNKGGPTLAS